MLHINAHNFSKIKIKLPRKPLNSCGHQNKTSLPFLPSGTVYTIFSNSTSMAFPLGTLRKAVLWSMTPPEYLLPANNEQPELRSRPDYAPSCCFSERFHGGTETQLRRPYGNNDSNSSVARTRTPWPSKKLARLDHVPFLPMARRTWLRGTCLLLFFAECYGRDLGARAWIVLGPMGCQNCR